MSRAGAGWAHDPSARRPAARRAAAGGGVSALSALDHRVPAPMLAAGIALAMHGLVPATVPGAAWHALADGAETLLLLLSAPLALAAFAAFWRAHTTIDPLRPARATTLVTGGVYRLSRNPMYLSLAMLLLAYAIHLGAWAALAGPAAFVLYVTRFQIVPEERALQRRFGDAFASYKARVRRWL